MDEINARMKDRLADLDTAIDHVEQARVTLQKAIAAGATLEDRIEVVELQAYQLQMLIMTLLKNEVVRVAGDELRVETDILRTKTAESEQQLEALRASRKTEAQELEKRVVTFLKYVNLGKAPGKA